MNFKLSATPALYFGSNKIKLLPELIEQFGQRALIITGRDSFLKSFIAMELFNDLDAYRIENKIIQIEGEPTPGQIDAAVNECANWKPEVVVAIGGGSVMDAGKAVSAMLCETGSIIDFLEAVGTRLPSGKKIPFIAIPTTAGTGSEATKNAVITKTGKDGFKKSLRHDNYIPNFALVDPSLTISCTPSITAASGMDAFTQLLESYLSLNSTPFTDALAFEGIRYLLGAIEKAVENGDDLTARSDMSYATFLSGITLANAGLGLVHGFAQPLGSLFAVPHGIACGTLMGATNRITVQRLREENANRALNKYFQLASLISSEVNPAKAIDQFLDKIDFLCEKFQLAKLSAFGITEKDFPLIIENTGLKYHPVNLCRYDLKWILKQRL